jgi:hypothetical protein
MPISLAKAREQAQGRAISKLGTTNEFEFFVASNILEKYGTEFKAELERLMKERQISASGDLADSINSQIDNEGKRLTITMLDYYDFVNEGVQGWYSSKNASTSPYSYKRKAKKSSNGEFQKSIKEYILSGKAKVTDKKTMGRTVLGLERKGVQFAKKKSLIDRQVDTLIYNIKKYGIKKTDYFTDAFEKVFANWEQDMAEAFGEDMALSLQLKKK